ncbi:exocyst complex component sec5 [Acrodontium crateriforme]|uniref:Exocyst complex component SEC5 n=1 Tax=Acrodontium crateriforme TaxID=150365 RepID=A0AAQ3LXC8_9PEZI|nr:exocyst complex component sec5 [Acrodontium crateriforme]
MPINADQERRLLNAYTLNTLYPTEWPQNADESSDEDEDLEDDAHQLGNPVRHGTNHSKASRSSLRRMDRHASMGGSQKADGMQNLVQKDEPDPLGMAPSVSAELRRRGLPVEDNLKLRNRFMLSSTTFSPALFLAQVHQDASTEDLLRGLDFLSRSIEQKSASLKVLVESNFEKFVRAQATIDNVYTEMRAQGSDAGELQVPGTPSSKSRRHSRHASKTSSHFRNTSGAFSTTGTNSSDKKKNALTKDSDYGVQGIKTPLQDLSIKAEEVWGPALGGQEKEETLKAVLGAMEQHREIFRLSSDVFNCIKKGENDGVVEAYKMAKKYKAEAVNIADIARANNVSLGDTDAQQIILTAKMWHDVSLQIGAFKRDVWKRLKTSHTRKGLGVTDESDKEMHMDLIGVLLQLGVDENPIWVWLNSHCQYLKDRITQTFERSRIEIEILRRRLGSHEKTDTKTIAKFLQSAVESSSSRFTKDASKELDSPTIIAFWEKVYYSLNALLSPSDGLLGEVLELWDITQSFIDNKAQKAFPSAVFAVGLEHLELEPDDVASLRSGTVELVNLLRENVLTFFTEAPVQDLSDMYSPIPPTPLSAGGAITPGGAKQVFSFDPSNLPPPSPSRGDSWEKFAFWPPHSNSLSGSHYLSRAMVIVGTAAGDLASLPMIKQARATEPLKALVNAVRERCVQAVCAAWATDAERCKFLEAWTRNAERPDLTNMPVSFLSFEEKVLSSMQTVAYVSEASSTRGGGADVVMPPPAKLLQAVRGSFVTSLYKALSGMVENAENTQSNGTNEHDPDGVTLPQRGGILSVDTAGTAVNAANRNVRMLMTLSNLAYLRSEIIPHLISQFESSFSVKLTEESKTIRDVLGQIDARLFQSYVKPTVDKLSQIIATGVASPSWNPQEARPTDARPYVYDVLLVLVLVHSEVSTTASTLTNQILSYFLEQSSQALIAAFRTRDRYPLPALMQATLDVEFMAQTLNNYTTDRAGEVQSQIYLALDERTDDEARKQLQGELPEMRAILKRLREGTKGEFGCFKKERRGRENRNVSK